MMRSAMSRAPAGLWSSFSGKRAAERRDAGAHHVHRMRRRRQRLEHVARPRAAGPRIDAQLGLVRGKLAAVRQQPWISR